MKVGLGGGRCVDLLFFLERGMGGAAAGGGTAKSSICRSAQKNVIGSSDLE